MTIARTISAALFLRPPTRPRPARGPASYPSRTVRLSYRPCPAGRSTRWRASWPTPSAARGRCRSWSTTSRAPAPRPAACSWRSRRPTATRCWSIDSIAVNPSLYPNLAYDPIQSFEPVSLLMTATQVLVVRPDLGVDNLKEFIELPRARTADQHRLGRRRHDQPSHRRAAGAARQLQNHGSPFRGAAPALSAMLGGHVDGMWVMLAPAVPHLRSGKLKAVAVTAAQRDPELPAVPTASESGVSDFQVENWQALFGPAGMPNPSSTRSRRPLSRCSKSPRSRAACARSASSRAATAGRW